MSISASSVPASSVSVSSVSVSGGASDEELSVVLAVLAARPTEAAPSEYELWRRTRLQALRRTADRSAGRNSGAGTG